MGLVVAIEVEGWAETLQTKKAEMRNDALGVASAMRPSNLKSEHCTNDTLTYFFHEV